MKTNSILSTLGESGMIALLVVLFVTPFVVATLLTPRIQPDNTNIAKNDNSWGVKTDSKTVLGAGEAKVKELRMQTVKGNGVAETDSYVTSDTSGRFLYRVNRPGDAIVFKLVNEGTLISSAKVRVASDFDGALRAGSTVLDEKFVRVKVAPGGATEITISANSLGTFELWVEID